MTRRPSRYAAGAAAAGIAATVVQFVRARNGYPWFDDLDPSGEFGDPTLPAVDLLLVGDSTCTGNGLDDPDDIWVRQLMPVLTRRYFIRLASAAVGGSQLGDLVRDQLPVALTGSWDVVFVSVGANDALRSPSLTLVQRNLTVVVDALQERAQVVVLAGVGDLGSPPRMLVPFNWLLRFRSWQADRVHRRVARRRQRVHKVDMRADGHIWRSGADLWAPDRFHPNRAGHALWAASIGPVLEGAIAEVVAAREATRP